MKSVNRKKYNFIDLFAGCGGLSEGFYKQGYNALAHVEINPIACKTLRTRMKYYGYDCADEAVLLIAVANSVTLVADFAAIAEYVSTTL